MSFCGLKLTRAIVGWTEYLWYVLTMLLTMLLIMSADHVCEPYILIMYSCRVKLNCRKPREQIIRQTSLPSLSIAEERTSVGWRVYVFECVCVCMCMWMRVCVCVCVYDELSMTL